MSTGPTLTEPKPYVGPQPIQDCQLFFGRGTEIGELSGLLRARRIVLLHAASGAGKTSLIHAGVIPAMEEQGFLALPTLRISRLIPPGELAGIDFNRYVMAALISLEEGLPLDRQTPLPALAKTSLVDYLEHRRTLFVEYGPNPAARRLLLIFDQFEEILTLDPEEQSARRSFFDQLMALMYDTRCWFLFSMREEFLARLDPYLSYFPDRLSAHYHLEFLNPSAALQAIQAPAARFGVTFEDDAADKLKEDLRQVRVATASGEIALEPGPTVEPVQLQVVCSILWEAERPDRARITLADVEKWGRVEDALSHYYAGKVAEATRPLRASERSLRGWIGQKLITRQGLRSQVLSGPDAEFGVTESAIRFLIDAYLVREEQRRGAVWLELAHDRLVEPVLVNNRAWFLANLSLLQRQAELWKQEGFPNRLLLHDDGLREAEVWLQTCSTPLTAVEQDLLERSRALQKEKEDALEDERRMAHRIRRYLAIAVGVAVLAICSFFVASWAYGASVEAKITADAARELALVQEATAQAAATAAVNQKTIAEAALLEAEGQKIAAEAARANAVTQQAAVVVALNEVKSQSTLTAIEQIKAQEANSQALSQRLAFQAQQLFASNPDLAALLGIEAYRAADTTEATTVLLSSIYTSTLTIENVAPVGPFNSNIHSLSFSPDEKYLAVGVKEGLVFLVDLQAEVKQPLPLPGRHTGTVYNLAFSPDGTLLASSGIDNQFILHQVGTEQWQPYPLDGGSSGISFHPDGRKLAVGSSRRIYIYDVKPGSLEIGNRWMVPKSAGFVHELVYSPDGQKLAASEEGEAGSGLPDWVMVYDANTGSLIMNEGVHTEIAPGLAWALDSRWLVSGSLDGSLIVWDILLKSYEEHTKAHASRSIFSLTSSYDGRFLLSGGYDGYVRIWDLPSLQERGEAPNPDLLADVLAVAFSPRSYLFASGGTDKLVMLRRLVTQPALAEEVSREDGPVENMVVDPEGFLHWVYPGSDGFYQIASTDSRFPLTEKPHEIGRVFSTALHPSTHVVAFGGSKGTIYTVSVEQPYADPWPAIPLAKDIQALAYSADGRQLASSFYTVKGGGRIAYAIFLWDVETRESRLFAEVPASNGKVISLAFDPTGTVLAAGTHLGEVLLFDRQTNRRDPINLKPSPAGISGLAFSRDGKRLAAGTTAGDMILWNAAQGYQEIGRINTGSGGGLLSLAFDVDELHLYTGSETGTILRWAISPDLWVDIICQRVNRNLTLAEWRTFFFNEDLRPTCP